MEMFGDFLAEIDDPEHRARTEEVLAWVMETFPQLEPTIKWNQPMFTDHGTFIIGISVAKPHLAVSPEAAGIRHFADAIAEAGYDHTDNLIRIGWEEPVDYSLFEEMVAYNISEKAECSTFWRK